MLFETFSGAVFGIDAYLVEVEVDIHNSFQGNFNVVGLPDIAVKKSRERIKSALRNCGFDFSLAANRDGKSRTGPDMRREGSAFDLPMALGLLGGQGTYFGKILDSHVFLGELSLDGSVRSVRGGAGGAGAKDSKCSCAGGECSRGGRGGRCRERTKRIRHSWERTESCVRKNLTGHHVSRVARDVTRRGILAIIQSVQWPPEIFAPVQEK
jgi:Subunit ChlI of Mg-chelatase